MQTVVVRRKLDHERSEERSTSQAERLARAPGSEVHRLALALRFRQMGQVDQGQRKLQLGLDGLLHGSFHEPKGRAPDLVSTQDRVEALLQPTKLERASTMDCDRLVVEGEVLRDRGM